jgi:hypothetical protein
MRFWRIGTAKRSLENPSLSAIAFSLATKTTLWAQLNCASITSGNYRLRMADSTAIKHGVPDNMKLCWQTVTRNWDRTCITQEKFPHPIWGKDPSQLVIAGRADPSSAEL